jgi:urea transport system ATP-binding protein
MNALEVVGLHVSYGESRIIEDVSLRIAERESLALMGRNGMGKTTLLKALIGMLPIDSGSVRLGNRDVTDLASHKRVEAGLAYVPQGRMIFPYLTVEENLLAGMETVKEKLIPDFVYDVFPVLKEMRSRRGGNLSGGQQQQLAIARALVSRPKVFLLDEPTEGIQPSIIKDIAKTLNELRAEMGFALLVTEQALSFAMDTADRFLIIERGRIAHEATRDNVDEAEIRSYLTI